MREFRVVWRREHDKTKRTRLYQTQRGAEDYARFMTGQTWEELGETMDDYSIEHLRELGDPIDVVVESREVGEWGEGG